MGGGGADISEECEEVLNALPSADRPQGKWINGVCTNGTYYKRCNQCFSAIDETFFAYDFNVNFCPNCGAKMKGIEMNNEQWIEGTPEPNELVGNVLKYYLVQDVWGDMHVAHYRGNNKWSLMDGNDNIYDVIVYQELPPIYENKESQ